MSTHSPPLHSLPIQYILVTGGHNNRNRLDGTEILRLGDDSWTQVAAYPKSVLDASCASLPGGEAVMCAGGWDGTARSDEVIWWGNTSV